VETVKGAFISEGRYNVIIELLMRSDKYLRSFEAIEYSFDKLYSFLVGLRRDLKKCKGKWSKSIMVV